MPCTMVIASPLGHNLREIVAALMCSPLYFELTPAERLRLIKALAEA